MTADQDDSDPVSTPPPAVHPTKVYRDWFPTSKREQIGERLYTYIVTHVPSNFIRVATLRFFGAKIGRRTVIGLGCRFLGLEQLSIGDDCVIGTRCLLDARGEMVIADRVWIDREVQLISGQHVVDSNDFGQLDAPIYIDEGARIDFRTMVLIGVQIGANSVTLPCSLVREDVEAGTIVSGIPAVKQGSRTSLNG